MLHHWSRLWLVVHWYARDLCPKLLECKAAQVSLTAYAWEKRNGWHGRIFELTVFLNFSLLLRRSHGFRAVWGPSTDTHVHTSQGTIVLFWNLSNFIFADFLHGLSP
jgi:hypothetical protein